MLLLNYLGKSQTLSSPIAFVELLKYHAKSSSIISIYWKTPPDNKSHAALSSWWVSKIDRCIYVVKK